MEEYRTYFDESYETCEVYVEELDIVVKFVPFIILPNVIYFIN